RMANHVASWMLREPKIYYPSRLPPISPRDYTTLSIGIGGMRVNIQISPADLLDKLASLICVQRPSVEVDVIEEYFHNFLQMVGSAKSLLLLGHYRQLELIYL